MALHAYSGPSRVYPFLLTGDPGSPAVAPFTVADGTVVDFGDCDPPDDGSWSLTKKRTGAALPDNHVTPDAPTAPPEADPAADPATDPASAAQTQE